MNFTPCLLSPDWSGFALLQFSYAKRSVFRLLQLRFAVNSGGVCNKKSIFVSVLADKFSFCLQKF